MSKKKNTLQDLNDFLKQQAAALVSPDKLGEKFPESPEAKSIEPVAVSNEISAEKILHDLKLLSEKEGSQFRKKLYDLIVHSLEGHKNTSPEDMMLINTALYLKYGEHWQEKIREYWRDR